MPRQYARSTPHVGEGDFVRGRIAVLRELLAAPRLYRTELGHARWEERARANMAAEIAQLTEQASGFAPS